MKKYIKTNINANTWVITDKGKDFKKPKKLASYTFAFDTETLVFLDGKIKTQKELLNELRDVKTEEKRKRVSSLTWAWLSYDEYNGFFMTNDFLTALEYYCRCGYKYGWCYNATFDFSQIDYEILAKRGDLWKPHEKGTGKAYNKRQPYTYESLHSDVGTRYAYKLWIPYKNENRHVYTHAVEIHDFMKLCGGGLKRVLEDLNVVDNKGKPIRKLDMDYQAVDPNNLSEKQIDYCKHDVKGLYFAVKTFNKTIEQQTKGEEHIYGKDTNLMTSGGLAKREMLRSIYPSDEPKYRLKHYQKEHKVTEEQDKYARNYSLYRGGITYLNKRYKGKLITNKIMYKYDVNSEYPYAMANIRDLIGTPFTIKLKEWVKYSEKKKEQYECIYILTSVTGFVRKGMLGVWYNPLRKDFVDIIDEDFTHLVYERELTELGLWYDLSYECEDVILIRRGKYTYKRFIEKYYKIKAQAKKDKNKTLQQVAKLCLNSSYGKLAERVERGLGHYELNKETGAIHFIQDGVETNYKTIMSVFVGALVTAYARCYILSKIRELCENVERDFVYIDTDSIAKVGKPYDKADAYKLGGLKLEGTYEAFKYIAPKTYLNVRKVEYDGLVNLRDVEIHSKGISLIAIMTEVKEKVIKNGKELYVDIDDLDEFIAYGKKYVILCAMNVKGGKVLLPTEKYLARWELAEEDEKVYHNNANGLYLSEK